MKPLVSIFIPSHNSKHLQECLVSALNQNTSYEYEIVLVLNGEAKDYIVENTKNGIIKVFREDSFSGVGEAKRACVEKCSGEYLIELDHDDLLLPNAVEEVVNTFKSGNYSVVYSDFVEIDEKGEVLGARFSSRYGWEYDRYEDGVSIKSFKPTPDSFSFIWYMPNHLRAFRRDLYNKVGGYSLKRVLDDQDLLSKLYLEEDWFHIEKVLYKQRVHKEQTQNNLEINKEIQDGTINLFLENIEKMSLVWAKRNNLLALDLGGAHNKKEGYKSVDLHSADIVADLSKPFPFKDNSVGVIRAYDFIEHIPNKIKFWNEVYRVLAPNSVILIMVPSSDGRGAYQDPTHCAFYNENSFWYYTKEEYRKYIPQSNAKFVNGYTRTFYPSEFHEYNKIPYVQSIMFANKGDRIAGYK